MCKTQWIPDKPATAMKFASPFAPDWAKVLIEGAADVLEQLQK